MADASIWDQAIEVPEDVISFVDNQVFASKQFCFQNIFVNHVSPSTASAANKKFTETNIFS
jgi:hypothetical protein